MLFHFVNLANVGMVERRGGTRFSLETFHRSSVVRQLLRQELQGNAAAQLNVLSLIDHSHASATDYLEHSVMGDLLANPVCGERGKKLGAASGIGRHPHWRGKPIAAFGYGFYVFQP